ncbi:flippase [candidate division KSB1 bacterium]|nr:flippase [candidate division KSB1 bacterium]
MNFFRTMIKNTIARSVSEIFSRLGSAVFWVLVARSLGASGLGTLAFVLSLFALFSNLSFLGMDAVLIRDVAQKKSKAPCYFGHMLVFGLVSGIVFMILMIGIAFLLGTAGKNLMSVVIMAGALLPASIFQWSRAILFAYEKVKYIAVARAAENLFKVSVGLWVLMQGYGIFTVVCVVALSKLVGALVAIGFAVNKGAAPDFHLNVALIKYFSKLVPQFSLISVFNSLFWSMTVILLTTFQGEAQAGIFSAAYKIVDVCLSFAFAYGQALFPVASRISVSDPGTFRLLCHKSIKYTTLLTIAISIGTLLVADKIIFLLYGLELASAVPVLRILIWILVPFAIVPVLAYALVSSHLQRHDLFANISASIVLFAANIILVPRFNAIGAAFALLIGCTVFMLIEFFWVSKKLFKIKISLKHFKLFIAVFFMSLSIFIFRNLNILLTIGIGVVTYAIFLKMTNTITIYELRLLRK